MIVRGSELRGERTYRAEVIVIGSGSGGAVVAKELAEEGLDVMILEEGAHYPPEVYGRWRPSQTARKLARSAGVLAALGLGSTPPINIMMGRCVGGSSVLTGGVCFRIPKEVHREWSQTLDTEELSAEQMEFFYRKVEDYIQVREVPENLRSKGTVLFGEGAKRLGTSLLPLRRNAPSCRGCSRCNFGCPHQAKLSVDLTYLPRAMEKGAKIYSEHRVDRILIRGRRAIGVTGRLVDRERERVVGQFTAYAPIIVLAAGSLHTPLILLQSKLRVSPWLGRNLTLHPAFRICAFFEEKVENWKGALQSAFCHHPSNEKLLFVSVMAPLGTLVSTVPGIGRELRETAERFPYLATFGGMVHDEPGGKIWGKFFGEPIITYKMDPKDRLAMLEGIRFLAEAYLLAGAKRVLMPIPGSPPIDSLDQLRKFEFERVDARKLECLSFHPQGSARMAKSPREGVVSRDGELFSVSGLWIADASLFPTSVGVNTQIPVMAMATRVAHKIAERRRKSAGY